MSHLRTRALTKIHLLSTPGARRMLRRGVWGLGDNALISATNFVMMVLLARVLSPRDFGLYALAYTALIFINGMQSAIVTQPHTMLGSPLSGQEFARYTTNTMWSQVILSIATGLVMVLFGIIATQLEWGFGSLLYACAPATAAWQMQEFLRRVLYTRSNVAQVFINDLISYGGQFALVILLWKLGNLTIITAFAALTVTSVFGVLIGVWQIRAHLCGFPAWEQFRTTTVSNWNFGKWLLGSNLATWTSGRIYPILAAGIISVAATGAMKAVQTILGPMNVLTFAMDPLFGPKSAQARATQGIAGLRVMVGRMQLFMLCTVGTYCLLVSIFAGPILERVYGSQYAGYAWLLVIMAINYSFTAFRQPLSIALAALGETNALFRVRLASTAANLTVGLAAVYVFGFPGIGVGILLNGLVLQLVTWHYYLQFTDGIPILTMLKRPRRSTRNQATLEST